MENPESFEDLKMGVKDMQEWMKKNEVDQVHKMFLARVMTIVIAGLGLVAALAWDRVLRDIFVSIFGEAASLGEKIGYALVVTFIATLASVFLTKLFLKKSAEKTTSRKKK